ncbi:MAG: anti-sigma factor [Undibacterium sp.]|nr:anti-sigma factor [Opitutaceae bacterium]
MNAERHEELAALAALDLLTSAEQTEFAFALASHSALAALVDSLRSASAELAHTAPAVELPAAIRSRVLATIAALPASGSKPSPLNAQPSAKLIPFPTWLALAAAACFALVAAYFGQAYQTEHTAAATLRDQQNLTDLALRSTQNQLEAERLIARRELADATAKAAESSGLLARLESRLTETTRAAAAASLQLASSREQIDIARRDLAARDQTVTDLTRQLAAQGTLTDYKISTLASLLGNTPQALAVAVWNPANQEGVLTVQKLPALAADKDYQLWIVDPQYEIPVNGGVFRVDPATGETRVNFRADQPIKSIAKFAVSLERKGGVPKAEGQMVLLTP